MPDFNYFRQIILIIPAKPYADAYSSDSNLFRNIYIYLTPSRHFSDINMIFQAFNTSEKTGYRRKRQHPVSRLITHLGQMRSGKKLLLLQI